MHFSFFISFVLDLLMIMSPYPEMDSIAYMQHIHNPSSTFSTSERITGNRQSDSQTIRQTDQIDQIDQIDQTIFLLFAFKTIKMHTGASAPEATVHALSLDLRSLGSPAVRKNISFFFFKNRF